MSALLLSEILATPSYDLLAIAIKANEDPNMIPVLGDAVIEMGWSDRRVMMLCIGVPIHSVPPSHLGERGKQRWRDDYEKSIDVAQINIALYQGKRTDWARAVLATMLFGGWRRIAKRTAQVLRTDRHGIEDVHETRSPWPTVRAQFGEIRHPCVMLSNGEGNGQ